MISPPPSIWLLSPHDGQLFETLEDSPCLAQQWMSRICRNHWPLQKKQNRTFICCRLAQLVPAPSLFSQWKKLICSSIRQWMGSFWCVKFSMETILFDSGQGWNGGEWWNFFCVRVGSYFFLVFIYWVELVLEVLIFWYWWGWFGVDLLIIVLLFFGEKLGGLVVNQQSFEELLFVFFVPLSSFFHLFTPTYFWGTP